MSRVYSLREGEGPAAKALLRYKYEQKLSYRALAATLKINHLVLQKIITDRPVSLQTIKRIAIFLQWSLEDTGVAVMYEPPPRGKKR